MEIAPTACHLCPHPFYRLLLLFLLTAFAIRLEFLLYLGLKISHVYFLSRFPSLTSFERFGVKIFVNGVGLLIIFLDFEPLIGKGIDSFADDSHLILVEAEILDAEGIPHDQIHLGYEFVQGQVGVFTNVELQLLQLF